jgi:hypothetical protein
MRLFEFELVWARAALGAVLPEDTELPHGVARMDPGRFMASAVAAAPFEQALVLRVSLWVVALAPLWVLRRPRTIASLAPAEQQALLDHLLASSVYIVRQLVLTLKAMTSLLYAQSPVARRAMLGAAPGSPIPAPLESGFVTLRTPREREHEHEREGKRDGTRAA